MNPQNILNEVLKLAALKYFPREPQAHIAIVEEMGEMCDSEMQVAWIVKRCRKLYHEWPGILELRAVMCSKFKPKDGIEACSAVYCVTGIPSEVLQTLPLLSTVSAKLLQPGRISEIRSVKELLSKA